MSEGGGEMGSKKKEMEEGMLTSTSTSTSTSGSKQELLLSQSYCMPRTLEDYAKKLSNANVKGVLERGKVTTRHHMEWEKVAMKLENGVLYVPNPEEDIQGQQHNVVVDLETVGFVRTAEEYGANVFVIQYQELIEERKIYLRAPSKEEMNLWLFGFHRSLAFIITKILQREDDDVFMVNTPLSETARVEESWRCNRFVNLDGTGHLAVSPSAIEAKQGLQAGLGVEFVSSARSNNSLRCISDDDIQNGDDREIEEVHAIRSLTSAEFDVVDQEQPEAEEQPPKNLYVPPHRKNTNTTSSTKSQRYIPPHKRNRETQTSQQNYSVATDLAEDVDSKCIFELSLDDDTFKGISSVLNAGGDVLGSNRPYSRPSKHIANGDVVTHEGQGASPPLTWNSGAYSCKGCHKCNEDQFCAIDDLSVLLEDDSMLMDAYFAVFDGHGGLHTSRYFRDKLHLEIINHHSFHTSLRTAITETFKKLDVEYCKLAREKSICSGTTAIVVYLRGKTLLVANLGDCAAVLCRSGTAIQLSEAHRPDREDERHRIELANGWITEEKELLLSRLHRMDLREPEIRRKAQEKVKVMSVYRVCGTLSVSRALGDIDYKDFHIREPDEEVFFFPEGHSKRFTDNLVTSCPEFQEIDITDEDEFLVIGCDGIWDYLTATEVTSASLRLIAEGKSALEVSQELAKLALKLGSSDDVTVIVIVFDRM